ncbi:MAG: type IV-A pilus assembly ATPase PilB [bacterium]|uniref:Type IV pilus assembly protein PilB n=2 Tax=Bacteria candidate phyla TaxID=1783234 RepID=A0A124G0M1_UNCT6|nr:MAG: Type IV pilus assembly protein PilB [candidate division TA06 bacterium 32_111]KUK87940.1 MAG: Type IV pilus assembly protein PilB [candidate division TA06 bacterium 34_109]MDI6700531.1 type IV-A pilus assembly ATPase PilB [bacterium]HAF08093.1 type IV-A pilus assembly ATPase PilB [candidate division WOR-3 bacterium]HCP16206.1 type IV-A pilus assembly ATPase PilB [candidate division WOR-3 bacterium]
MQTLANLFTTAGILNKEQVGKVFQRQKETGESFISSVVSLGFSTEEKVAKFLAKYFKTEFILIDREDIPIQILNLIPEELATKHMMIPYKKTGNMLFLAMVNPANLNAIDDVKFKTGLDVIPVVTTETSLQKALGKYREAETQVSEFSEDDDIDIDLDIEEEIDLDLDEDLSLEDDDVEVVGEADSKEVVIDGASAAEDKPVVKIVNYIFTKAVELKASDIHIEPFENYLRVRLRVDGVLSELIRPPFELKAGIVSRIKLMSELDIAVHNIPQDGRIRLKVYDKQIDLRVSIIPVLFGEKVVMRILDKSALQLEMTKLGFEPDNLEKFQAAIHKPYGIVLVTGPTGSGKSTTLYSALSSLNSPEIQIMTAEDPVEYNLYGINQVQVNPDIGFTFASALRAFLRQSPNVILVGEIRDTETAEIAVRAALTGHLVVSTIHTNDSPSTVNRLIDMGIEPFLVSAALNLIQAQRLLRKVCEKCRKPVVYDEETLKDYGIDPLILKGHQVYEKGDGCDFCGGKGYKGRLAVTEVMPISPKLREMILARASTAELREQAKKEGMKTLRDDALIKVKKGLTTLDEVIRETAVME